MEISVKNKGKLERLLQIELPAEEVDKSFHRKLSQTSRKIRLPGFRPGKVSPKVVQDMFGQQLLNEVAATMMESAYKKAITENNITPAGEPKFDDVDFALGAGIKFTASLEVLPEFEPVLLSGMQLELPVSEIDDAAVDDLISKMRLDQAEWQEAETASAIGDRVTVQFDDAEAKKHFPIDGKQQMVVQVGDPILSKEFSDQFLNVDKDSALNLKPQSSEQKSVVKRLFKRANRFSATAVQVQRALLPELDEQFFQKYNIKEGGLEKFREFLRGGLKIQLEDKVKQAREKKIADALIEKNSIDVPQVMIKQEIKFLRRDMAARLNMESEKAEVELKDEMFRDKAEYNLRLSLVVRKIADQHKIKIDNKMFEAKLDEIVKAYESPAEMKRYLRRESQAHNWVQTMILREQVFAMASESATLKEKLLPFSELVNF